MVIMVAFAVIAAVRRFVSRLRPAPDRRTLLRGAPCARAPVVTPALIDADAILTEAVRRIGAQFHPRRIVLFGSRARGQAQADSDYDLLVVVDGQPDVRRLEGAIRWSLLGLPAAFDVLVEPEASWDKWRRVPVAIQHEIATQGRVMFDAG